MRRRYLILAAALLLFAGREYGRAQDAMSCGPCHAGLTARYSRTGMARSFAPAKDVTPGSFRHAASGQLFTVAARDGAFWLRREQAGFDGKPGNIIEKRLEFQFGSGDRARSYFARDARGNLIELPLTWYAEKGGHWGMSPGYDSAQHAGFTRKVNERCFFCHNTDAGQTARGIGCERCHGPGGAHIAAVREGRGAAGAREAIINPARLSPPRRQEVCLQCHLETTNLTLPGHLPVYSASPAQDAFAYRPGQPLGDFALYFDHAPGTGHDKKFEISSAPYRLFQSACYRHSPDQLTCSTCHNPHQPESDHTRTLAACRSCHAGQPDHHPGQDCVSCHMAVRRPSDALQVTIQDHLIRRLPPRDASTPATETNSAVLPPYRGPVVPYYPSVIPEDSGRQLYLAVAQVRNQANLGPGIVALEKAIGRFRPRRAEFYLDLADALRLNQQFPRAIAAYGDALSRDDSAWRAWYGLGLAQSRAGDPAAAESSFRRALRLAPGEAAVYEALARLLLAANRLADGIATLRSGLLAIPDSPDLANTLGTFLLQAGDFPAAEASLREAIRLRPELAALRVNLATLLARGTAYQEAKFEFATALRLDPASAPNHSAFATALAAHGELQGAREHFEAALRLSPALPNTRNNLGIVLGQLGDRSGAIREFRAAISLDPGFFTAHRNLADALAASGQPEEAAREKSLAEMLRNRAQNPAKYR